MFKMKWAPLAAAGLFAMTAVPAAIAAEQQIDTNTKVQFAAGEKSTPTTGAPGTTTPAPSAMEGKSGNVSAQELIGKEITNAGGDSIGEVNSVIIGDDGEVNAVVVGVGGFLGMGEHDVALKWDEVKPSPDGKELKVSMTKDQLKAMPEYEYSDTRKKGGVYKDGTY